MKKLNLFLVILLSASLVFTGCDALNNTAKGAIIGTGAGAAVGAGIGGLIGKDGKSAAVGAAIGGVVGATAGAIIGKKMDKAAAETAAQVAVTEAAVVDNRPTSQLLNSENEVTDASKPSADLAADTIVGDKDKDQNSPKQ